MTAAYQPRIAIVGAGAVGGWIGGRLAHAGFDITLVDPWPEHVQAMQTKGLTLTEPNSTIQVPVKALHIGEVQSLHRAPMDLAFVCVKLYDTDWATALIAPYLAESGYIVTLQNGLIEERIAAVVGWGRTVGCIGGGLHLAMAGPGHIHRSCDSGKTAQKIFHVGEVHGRETPRVQFLAQMLEHVDHSEVTSNLWGSRWGKLVANCMTSALSAVSGLPTLELFTDPNGQKIMTRLAAEAIATGSSLGFLIEDIFGLAPARWLAAASGDPAACTQVSAVYQNHIKGVSAGASSGMAQDFARDRRTEIDYMNGYIAIKAAEAGKRAPTHAALAALARKMSARKAVPSREAMQNLLAA